MGAMLGKLGKSLLALFVFVVAFRTCSQLEDHTKPAPVVPSASVKPSPPVDERPGCEASLSQQRAEYASLMKERKYWPAATVIRRCAMVLKRDDLDGLLKEAEVKSHLADINNPKVSPREKVRAIEMLARDYPDVGKKYEGQVAALLARADSDEAKAKIAAKKAEGVRIGMTKDDVLSSSWGRPESVNTTTTVHGTHEQWVYSSRSYLYFDNGILTAIQN